MSEKEFLDLLRYYFRNVKTEDVEEILNDYRSHFADAKEKGMTEEEITKELGRPEDIYLSYRTEGVVNEKGHMERLSDRAEILADKTQKKQQRHGMNSVPAFLKLPVLPLLYW